MEELVAGPRGIHDIQTCYTPPLPASIITQHQTPVEQLHVNTTIYLLGFTFKVSKKVPKRSILPSRGG